MNTKIKPVHPFPARMAPEIAIAELQNINLGARVLDPMMGSGTVIRQAVSMGHSAVGYDMDPLAVLMTKVWSTQLNRDSFESMKEVFFALLRRIDGDAVSLPWIDADPETLAFTEFWFGKKQRKELRAISFLIDLLQTFGCAEEKAVIDAFKIALSRIIVTKQMCASLARDTSHGKPHKCASSSEYDVRAGFLRSLNQVRDRMDCEITGYASTGFGDARRMTSVKSGSVDLVLTSPPYLNAIDYMRGHRLSLVWLGHSLKDLRQIRSETVGAERRPDSTPSIQEELISSAMVDRSLLEKRVVGMIDRFAMDMNIYLAEIARVLKPDGKAVMVVGNSCLKGVYIQNSEAVVAAGIAHGLRQVSQVSRALPSNNRYLPTPAKGTCPLGDRMRTEHVITLAAA